MPASDVPAPPTRDELRQRLAALSLRDQRRFDQRLRRADGPVLAELAEGIAAAEERVRIRRAGVPAITYPAILPITDRRDDLLRAIGEHQVVIVAGETGSGKSTQLPKLCLELGRGVLGLIGHTQPRRVAARTIAERVAEELGTELGAAVGYTVRFTDRVGDNTYVKVMTDGILLAEIQRDRTLSRYDTLIIDEAHERSLNIDFLLGYLAQLLPQRPDLKLIVTSATIDTARFSEHFANAPIIEVTGRTYPVEVRYRPLVDDDAPDERDQTQAVCDAIDELEREGPGDVLVFLSGEREIHDTAEALRQLERRSGGTSLEVLPLYARLSSAEQHRIFQPHTGRRIVLSTNVAETSLTVPGVRYVVDAGAARISRYSHRLKVQRLPIEPVSQASANQRAGRCGRVAPGICIRLYSEDDFESRPAFTEPEILRTNLASVILQMTAIGLGDVAAFPFLDPPDGRAIRDGVALLEELGALDPDQPEDARRLTPLGRRLAVLPIDPRLARMVLEADRHGCVREVMIIASALSIQDPRERPSDKQQAADEAHRRFAVEGSDFLAFVRLWDHLKQQQSELSSNQFRKLCRTEYLNYLRVREWKDLYRQLRQATANVGVTAGTTAGHPDRVHQALLSGLLSHLGMRDGESREFRGARGSKFLVAPGSALAKKPPKWVMAAELVETNRLWARVVATIQPEWAEHLAGSLATHSFGDPRWDERRGTAVCTERVMLYGLPLVTGRQIGYDRVDKADARAMFIRHALVEGLWSTRHSFAEQNRDFVDSVRALGDRARRWNLVDDDAIFAFYDQRVGLEVVSTRHFDQWWKRAKRDHPELLRLTLADVTSKGAGQLSGAAGEQWPDTWTQGDLTFGVTYRFDPGDARDGVSVHIPITVLNRVTTDGFDWQVPGYRPELVQALVRTLPKQLRRNLTPLAETAQTAAARIDPADGSLADALAVVLSEIAGERIAPSAFDVREVTDHLRITFVVVDDEGRPIAVGKDLDAVRQLVGGRVRAAIAEAAPDIERVGITTWDFGDLGRVVETERAGHLVRGFPALIDNGDSVAIRVFSKPEIQLKIMPGGVRRLLLLTVPPPRKALERELTNPVRLAAAAAGVGLAVLVDDAATAAATALIDEAGGAMWEASAFDDLVGVAKRELSQRSAALARQAGEVLIEAQRVRAQLGRLVTPAVAASVSDAAAQLDRLVRPGFIAATGARRLVDLLRYVRGIGRRLDKLPESPSRDIQLARDVVTMERRYAAFVASLAPSQVTAEVVDAGWLLEELRISLFAQTLGTPAPVSIKRIEKVLQRLGERGR
ncbi:MAG: ATP-dependent helicase HrpA [Ilumatobacteraceae bacterium]|nr:ATP-dependent helicase HrpA [Ilumatobacteraceae bacterium]